MSNKKQSNQKITTIYVTPGGLDRMKSLAQKFGYLQTRGVGAGRVGSVSQLIEAIASGELSIHRPLTDTQEPALESASQH